MSILTHCTTRKRLIQSILFIFLISSSAHADDLLLSLELLEQSAFPRPGNFQVFVETDGIPNPYAFNGVPPVYAKSNVDSICSNNIRLAGGQINNAWLSIIYRTSNPNLDPDIREIMNQFGSSLLFVVPYGSDFADGSTGFNEPCFSSPVPIKAGFLILFLFTNPMQQNSGQFYVGDYVDCTLDLADCQFYRALSSTSQLF